MENITLTLDELNKMPKNAIALLYIQMSESFTILSAQSQKIQDQNERLIHQIEDLQEQIAILTQQRFGKRTETDKQVMGQLSFSLENMCVLNEAEALVENGIPDEPDIEKVVVRRKRTKGKRDLNLQNIEVEVINHDCSEEELREHFPKGWHPMEDEVKNFSIFQPDLKYWNIISKYMPGILIAAVFCVQKHRNVCWHIVFLPRNWQLPCLMQSM